MDDGTPAPVDTLDTLVDGDEGGRSSPEIGWAEEVDEGSGRDGGG